jgi:hypothetical protein
LLWCNGFKNDERSKTCSWQTSKSWRIPLRTNCFLLFWRWQASNCQEAFSQEWLCAAQIYCQSLIFQRNSHADYLVLLVINQETIAFPASNLEHHIKIQAEGMISQNLSKFTQQIRINANTII